MFVWYSSSRGISRALPEIQTHNDGGSVTADDASETGYMQTPNAFAPGLEGVYVQRRPFVQWWCAKIEIRRYLRV